MKHTNARRSKKNKTIDEVPADKVQAVAKLISDTVKDYGEDGLSRLGDLPTAKIAGVIPTGSVKIDWALGIGGYPRGRIIEVYGKESSGKTTLALHAIANIQKRGGVGALVDMEQSMDVDYAKAVGIVPEDLLFCQPTYGEQAFSLIEDIVRRNIVDLIVVDSVAALVPKSELEHGFDHMEPGMQARMMSKALRKLTPLVHKTNTCLMFINQTREKIGVMWGSKVTTPGGRALGFYASQRVEIIRIASVKDGDEHIGNKVKVKVAKNKMAPPFREIETEIIFGKGINSLGDLLDFAIDLGIVDKSGGWYSFKGMQLGHGKDDSVAFLRRNKKHRVDIKKDVQDTLHPPAVVEDVVDEVKDK